MKKLSIIRITARLSGLSIEFLELQNWTDLINIYETSIKNILSDQLAQDEIIEKILFAPSMVSMRVITNRRIEFITSSELWKIKLNKNNK